MSPESYIDTVQAPTRAECQRLTRERYGDRAYILKYKTVMSGGFFGFFAKENVIASVIVPPAKTLELPKYQPPAQPKPAEPGLDMGEILNQIKALGNKIDTKLKSPPPAEAAAITKEHETLVKLESDLERNDFSPSFRREILDRVRREFALDALNDYDEVQQKVLAWMGERVKIYSGNGPHKRPRVIVLVGPTGVGKTTTLCKLAASLKYFPENSEKQDVCFITIDVFRIAAAAQLKELAACLQADCAVVYDQGELKKELALRSDSFDAVLIDTIGRSPRDSVELAKMKKMLEVCGSDAEVYLTFMAQAKYSDIIETMRQFEPFGYRAVIVTKLDETRQSGNVISALAETSKPLAFVTNGQPTTPKYIQRGGILTLLTNLEGFTLDRDRMEAYFTQAGPREAWAGWPRL